MDQKKIYDIISENNLQDKKIKTYVQLFTDGSYFFWNKNISFTQYINDINHNLQNFYLQIRNQNFSKDSIFAKKYGYTNDLNKIINSQFYKRMDQTYIFDRNYKQIIKAADSNDTFFYCQIEKLTNQIFEELKKIKGKFLVVCNNCEDIDFSNYKHICQNELFFIFNYQNNEEDQEYLF